MAAVRMARPWLIASGLLLLLRGALPGALAAGGGESFGRWEHRPKQCRVQTVDGDSTGCSSVRLDQRDTSVLRLSVLVDRAGRTGVQQLTLVGVLAEGSSALVCRAGECELPDALQMQIVGASELALDDRGLALALPLTWSAQGGCRVDPGAIHCSARGSGSEVWLVEVRLR